MSLIHWRRCCAPLLDLLFPWRCLVCDCLLGYSHEQAICQTCLDQVHYLGPSVCRICGTVLKSGAGEGYLCEACIRKPPEWDSALSVIRYGPPVKDLLHRLKYNADTTVLPAFATVISPFLENLTVDCDIIVPVPLHQRRLRMRGLNQALCLARLFFPDRQGLINSFVLKREKYTLPQTGLNGRERRRNLRGAFSLTDPADIRGKHVCLVDDVYTTGTTLNECCRVVRQAGSTRITVITLARVVMGD